MQKGAFRGKHDLFSGNHKLDFHVSRPGVGFSCFCSFSRKTSRHPSGFLRPEPSAARILDVSGYVEDIFSKPDGLFFKKMGKL